MATIPRKCEEPRMQGGRIIRNLMVTSQMRKGGSGKEFKLGRDCCGHLG